MQSKSRWIARRALLRIVALTLGAALALVVAPVATSAAAISITEPAAGETVGPLPSFSGTTGEVLAPVTLHIYKGSTTSGSLVETLGPSEPPLLGKWSLTDETGLAAGTYTATSEQPEAVLEPGPSEPVTFTVNTKPPTITLEKLPPRSNEAKPTFSGTASEPGTVTVQVHEGTGNGGPVATTLTATVGETGDWSVTASSALSDGPYTAVATEPSAIGNGTGESPTRTFEIFTHPPAVEFTKVPAERSNQTKPAFEGTTTVGEKEPVLVHIHRGAEEVATLEATPSGGKWSIAEAAELPEGQYIAQATQASSIGNGPGSSEVTKFEVVTAVPEVTLQDLKSRSKVTKPTFRGTVTEAGTVIVHVHEGATTSGKVATTFEVSVPKAGEWSLIASKPLADGLYTAVATEQSGVGNGTGESQSRTFEVFTHPPAVEFTHGPDCVPSKRSRCLKGRRRLGKLNRWWCMFMKGLGPVAKKWSR